MRIFLYLGCRFIRRRWHDRRRNPTLRRHPAAQPGKSGCLSTRFHPAIRLHCFFAVAQLGRRRCSLAGRWHRICLCRGYQTQSKRRRRDLTAQRTAGVKHICLTGAFVYKIAGNYNNVRLLCVNTANMRG